MNLSGPGVTPLALVFSRNSSSATGTSRAGQRVTARQHALAEEAKALLRRWMSRRVLTGDLARHLGCSMWHLCHTFRIAEGMTINAYRTQLRLRAGVDRLLDTPDVDLTELALDLGFSSHSHFTAAFRRAFATTPSAFVRELKQRRAI